MSCQEYEPCCGCQRHHRACAGMMETFPYISVHQGTVPQRLSVYTSSVTFPAMTLYMASTGLLLPSPPARQIHAFNSYARQGALRCHRRGLVAIRCIQRYPEDARECTGDKVMSKPGSMNGHAGIAFRHAQFTNSIYAAWCQTSEFWATRCPIIDCNCRCCDSLGRSEDPPCSCCRHQDGMHARHCMLHVESKDYHVLNAQAGKHSDTLCTQSTKDTERLSGLCGWRIW